MNIKTRTTILLGAGFSKPIGLPLASEVEAFFVRDNHDRILTFGSGESKWFDFANETYRHNGRIGFDHIANGYILNEIVAKYIEESGSFISYEDFYQFVNDNLKVKGFLNPLIEKALAKFLEIKIAKGYDPYRQNYVHAFSEVYSVRIISLINHLISDLLYWRKDLQEVVEVYNRFLSYVDKLENMSFVTLNHDLLLECLLMEVWGKQYSDGFTREQRILFSDNGTPLNIFTGIFDKPISLIKLHGSIDNYKYLYYSEKDGIATATGEYLYFKTLDFHEKQLPNRRDPNTGKIVQSIHTEIMPRFITGTNKDKLIAEDKMYFSLYQEFEKSILNCERLLIIGYSYADNHVNSQIESALGRNTLKEIININPSKKFPFEAAFAKISNMNSMADLN